MYRITLFVFIITFISHFIITSNAISDCYDDDRIMQRILKNNITETEFKNYYNHAINNIRIGNRLEEDCFKGVINCNESHIYGAEGYINGGYRILEQLCKKGYKKACGK